MPGYVNPYMQTAAPYVGNYMMNPNYAQSSVPVVPQQSYATVPAASNVLGWQVDGEVGAKAFSVPAGATGPFALWDLNDNVVYMRTYNAAGMPNPLRKLRYYEEELTPSLPVGQSGASQIDTSQFATKNDFEQLDQKIQQLTNAIQSKNNMSSSQNQNGSNNRNGGNQGR